jgi:hypothetical protein
MPDLLDERQRLPIKRMFNANNHCLVLPAADFSEIESFCAANLDEIARIPTHSGGSGRQIDPQQVTTQTAEQSRLSVAIRQTANRNLLILLARHTLRQCIIRCGRYRIRLPYA